MSGRYFALSSKEHETLPSAELKGALEAEDVPYTVVSSAPGFIMLDSTDQTTRGCRRTVLTNLLCRHLFTCAGEIGEIRQSISGIDPRDVAEDPQEFAVRVTSLQNSPFKSPSELEPIIGEYLLKRLCGWRVNLSRPTVEFQGVVWEGGFTLGIRLYRRPSGLLKDREPSLRPAFHPATLTPRLARIMVNLARARAGSLFLDPFCGVGGILIEAGLIGCQLLGGDAKLSMCLSALKNLRHYSLDPLAIVQSDAESLPLVKVEAVATDPPYGTSASTMRRTTKDIIRGFLPECHEALDRGGFLCIASPKGVETKEEGVDAGFKLVESHSIFIHRRLTREITVFQR
ncbi:MAG: THUMP domain-containing protein [Candidatus Bathyarchaeia archaeon]